MLARYLVPLLVAVAVVSAARAVQKPVGEVPSVIEGHPRLLFQPATARQEAARLTRSPFWEAFRRRATADLHGETESPRALADALSGGGLLALATGDPATGALVGRAVERLCKVVEEDRWRVEDDLAQGFVLTDIAFGYDWAYPFLTPDQRRRGAAALVRLANYSQEKFPGYFEERSRCAFNNHTLWNHIGVAAAGMAAAGDHPEGQALAEAEFRTFTGAFLPVFDRFVGKSGIWNEGTHYNQVALKPVMIWMDAARTAMGRDFFAAPWVRSAAYYWVYLTRADDSMTILGDWWADRSETTVTNLMARTFWITARAARASNDPHLQAFARRQLPYALRTRQDVWTLLWFDPNLADQPVSELPPSRLFRGDPTVGGGACLAVLRSGWGPDARLITLSMGDWLSHHGHYDSNAFTIHYKGDLALDPGYNGESDVDWTHYRRTLAHNSLVVAVPEEQARRDAPQLQENGWGYDGGQRVPLVIERPRSLQQFLDTRNPEYPESSLWETGECLAFESRPGYDYVVGDGTRAYHRSQLTRFVRHLTYLKPDLVVLYDLVETPDGRRPRWLLQTPVRPVKQDGQLAAAGGEGELRVRTLLPEGAAVETIPALPLPQTERGKIGSPIFRSEVKSPAGKQHRFLHVLQITDRGAAPVSARWTRKGDRLAVTTGGSSARRTVELRWDGSPGVVVRSGE
jgi:hypothetical protein